MKKLFFFAIVALGMTAACQKPNVEVDGNDPDIDDNTPVAVQFNVNAPTLTVTKTKAAVESWADTPIYIYGYSDIAGTLLIDNKKATVASNGDVTFEKDEVFYYDVNAVYDFYGYYIDEITPATPAAVNANKDAITVEITIDGSQDVMLAKTDHAEDMAKATMPVNASRIYSAYTARRGVHPTLNFEHMLSRFVFKVKQGSSENKNEGKVQDVYVSGISLQSEKTGILTIAPAQSFEATGSKETLSSDINHSSDIILSSYQDRKYYKPTDSFAPAGSDLMIFPTDNDINLMVTLTPETEADVEFPKEYEMPVTLTPDMFDQEADAFLKGKQYVVELTVYGLEQITVRAELAEWGEGGTATYDPDNDYVANEIYATKANDGTNDVILYSETAIADGVAVYSDVELKTSADAGNYTTETHTFTVGDDGKVSSYAAKTQTPDDSQQS